MDEDGKIIAFVENECVKFSRIMSPGGRDNIHELIPT